MRRLRRKNINNSNKIIIGISIIFSTIILIIGSTTAFFSQSASGSTGNIVSNNDNNVYIEYYDVKNMMLDNIIPIKSSELEKAIYRENICVDDNNNHVCSAYGFMLQSTYEKDQKINISMAPTVNSFTNLKYILLKVIDTENLQLEILTESPVSLEKNNLDTISLLENETLSTGQQATYALVFYIENMGYDQTSEDAGKNFGATIRIDSISTGTYITKSFGKNCWNYTDTTLTGFNGIDMTTGEIDTDCSGYVSKEGDYYSINIPSRIGTQEITKLGNNLFSAFEYDENTGDENINRYVNIKKVIIEPGIKEIGDENDMTLTGTFMMVGYELNDSNYEFNVVLPDTLTKINDRAFHFVPLKSIVIPSNVEVIGMGAFSSNPGEVNLTLEGASDGTSKLRIIKDGAFSTLNNTSLVIPASVEFIGEQSFYNNKNLEVLTFMGALDGSSKLHTIGDKAFYNCNLTYESDKNPLILPPGITTMGEQVFFYNPNLNYIYFTGESEGFGNYWNFMAQVIKEIPKEENS